MLKLYPKCHQERGQNAGGGPTMQTCVKVKYHMTLPVMCLEDQFKMVNNIQFCLTAL